MNSLNNISANTKFEYGIYNNEKITSNVVIEDYSNEGIIKVQSREGMSINSDLLKEVITISENNNSQFDCIIFETTQVLTICTSFLQEFFQGKILKFLCPEGKIIIEGPVEINVSKDNIIVIKSAKLNLNDGELKISKSTEGEHFNDKSVKGLLKIMVAYEEIVRPENILLDKEPYQFSFIPPFDGVNFIAKCSRNECPSNGKEIYVHKGFGVFKNIARSIFTSSCPVCNHSINDRVTEIFCQNGYLKFCLALQNQKSGIVIEREGPVEDKGLSFSFDQVIFLELEAQENK